METLQIIFGMLNILIPGVLITIWIHLSEKKDSSTSKTLTCLTDLFSEYKNVMRNINTALAESEKLYEYLKQGNFSDFNKVYYSKEYETYREVGYFFELLGTLVKLNEINRRSVVHCFSFPIEFFMKTKGIRDIIRQKKCLPDYWGNFRYLCAFYNGVKKSTDKGWVVNGEIVNLSEEELKELPFIEEKNFSFWRWQAKAIAAAERNIRKANKTGTHI